MKPIDKNLNASRNLDIALAKSSELTYPQSTSQGFKGRNPKELSGLVESESSTDGQFSDLLDTTGTQSAQTNPLSLQLAEGVREGVSDLGSGLGEAGEIPGGSLPSGGVGAGGATGGGGTGGSVGGAGLGGIGGGFSTMGWVAGAVLGAGGLAAGLSSGGGGSKEPDKDTSSPILAITNNAPATINATTGSVLYTFTFNEAVTGFSAANVVVSNGLKGTFTALSSTVYTLQITPNGGTVGQLSVSVAAGAATDSSGNKSLAASSLVAIDTVPPVQTVTITSVSDDQPAITGVITSGGTTNDPTLSLAGQVSAALSPGESLAVKSRLFVNTFFE